MAIPHDRDNPTDVNIVSLWKSFRQQVAEIEEEYREQRLRIIKNARDTGMPAPNTYALEATENL